MTVRAISVLISLVAFAVLLFGVVVVAGTTTPHELKDPWRFVPQRAKPVDHAEFFEGEFGQGYKILESAFYDMSEFYAAVQHPKGYVFGLVCLVQFSNEWNYNIYYKDMDESMHPYYYRAPAKVLDLLDDYEGLSEDAKEWRKGCRQYLEARANRPKVRQGDMVVFANPIRFSNGANEDHFIFIKGSKFAKTRNTGYLNMNTGKRIYTPDFHITKWRDREYMLVPNPRAECKECGEFAFLGGTEKCPTCVAGDIRKYRELHA